MRATVQLAPVGAFALEEVGAGASRIARSGIVVQGGVDGGQGSDVDGQDLRVILVVVQVRWRSDAAVLLVGQAELVREAVAGLLVQLGPGRGVGGQR